LFIPAIFSSSRFLQFFISKLIQDSLRHVNQPLIFIPEWIFFRCALFSLENRAKRLD
jgi:hypothetical protein